MIQASTLRIDAELSFVAPAGTRLTRPSLDLIEAAVVRADVGDLTGARAVIADLEARLGVTEHHRIAATSSEPSGPFLLVGDGALISASIRARTQARSVAERHRALALIPRDIPPLTDADRYALNMVEQKLSEANTHKRVGNARLAKARIADARRILVNLEESRHGRHDMRWAERVLAEIEALEVALGGGVERKPLAGGSPLQIASRDGLYMLSLPKGPDKIPGLSRNQLAAGLAYRTLYERTDPERGLKPKSIDPADNTSSTPSDDFAERQTQRWNDRKRIDVRIKAVAGERGLYLLQEIAAKGRCIAHVSSGGKSRAVATARLIKALDEAAFAFGY